MKQDPSRQIPTELQHLAFLLCFCVLVLLLKGVKVCFLFQR